MNLTSKLAVVLIGVLAMAGCDRSHDPAPAQSPAGAPAAAHDRDHEAGHDHAHGDDGHSHDDPHTEASYGPDAAREQDPPASPAQDDHHHDHDHDHEDEAPHEHQH
jgi:hypothetical protein